MAIDPADVADDLDRFPVALRALLDAELAAGNAIAEVGHSHPAPPRGAYVRLEQRLLTSIPAGLDAYERSSSLWSTEVTDDDRAFWVLGAPGPPPEEPDMDAIRARASPPWDPPPPHPRDPEAWSRFVDSIPLTYERWHDGVGIDLAAIDELGPDERIRAEVVLLAQGQLTWREVEALAHLGTPGVDAALRGVLVDGQVDDRLAVLQHAPHLLGPAERDRLLVDCLGEATIVDGLVSLLDHILDHHPPEVRDALARAARDRDGEVAPHCAALLDHLEGPAAEPFDWDHRPLYLRFTGPAGTAEREAAFAELCARTGRAAGWV